MNNMANIFIALLIGVVAGLIDIIPMLFQKTNKYANLSAFFHWIFLGLVIPFVPWDIHVWLKGLILAEIAAIPVLFMVVPQDKKAFIPIVVMSAILGIGVALAGAKFIV